MFARIAAEAAAPNMRNYLEPRDLANLVWAFAAADIPAPDMFDAVAAVAREKINRFGARDLSTLAWAFAKDRDARVGLFETVADALPDVAGDLDASSKAQLDEVERYLRVALPQSSLLAALGSLSSSYAR